MRSPFIGPSFSSAAAQIATGLRGTYAFKHIADPDNGIWESDETNNEGVTIVRLPSGRAVNRSAADADNPY